MSGFLAVSPLAALPEHREECRVNSADADCSSRRQSLDWVPYSELPPERQSRRARNCQGAYVDPLAAIDTTDDPADQPVHATGETYELQGSRSKWTGAVHMQQGYRQLSGDRADYDSATGGATVEGNVEFREPGVYLRGQSSRLNSNSGEADMDNAVFLFHKRHVRGSAKQLRRRADAVIEMEQARYTYCPPTDEVWSLRADELELDFDRGIGTAHDLKLALRDTVFLYLPYLNFPIDERRKSGFLWPELGSDSGGGLDFATPYYFNLAPNYDLTLTPRVITNRGVLGEVQARYLGPILGSWDVGGAYINRDEEYRRDVPNDAGSRWLARVRHEGLVARRWRTTLDYTKLSDQDYLNEIGTAALNLRQSSHLLQRGQLDYLGNEWLAQLRVERFQTLARDLIREPYKKIPSLSLNRFKAERDHRVNWLYQGEYTDFDHDSRISGQRLYNEVGVSYPMTWISGFLKGTAKYRQIDYRLDQAVTVDGSSDDSQRVGAPLASLDGGLFLERDLNWGEGRLIQSLEPRLYYLWADYEEQQGLPDFDTGQLTFTYNQIFRENRFSGHGRLNDTNQLALGLTTRIIDPGSGEQKLLASIGQIYYFDDRRVVLEGANWDTGRDNSAIAAELAFQAWRNFDFNSSWLWDADAGRLDETHLRISWLNGGGRIFNLGYNWRRYRGADPRFGDINQFDLSAVVPIAGNWVLFFQTLYDLEEKDGINGLLGIEYDDCCWRVRLVHQRSLNQALETGYPGELARVSRVKTRRAIHLEFQFKGLGGVGARMDSILEEFIRGYEGSNE